MIIKTKNAEFDSASIFTSIDIFTRPEEIEKYIDKPVYLADAFNEFKVRIENNDRLKLKDFSKSSSTTFQFISDSGDHWAFCLPADKVTFIEPEKEEYRPFKTGYELVQVLGVDFGDVITWRFKNQKDRIYKEMITGIGTDVNKTLISVCLGDTYWTTEKLFKNMEYQNANGEWRVFGIKETEE